MKHQAMRSTRGFVSNGVLGALVAAFVIIFFVALLVWDLETIEGNEYAVLETWDGVVEKPFGPQTLLRNRWTETYYPYNMGGQLFVMNDANDVEDAVAEGRRFDVLEVVSADNQKVQFHIRVQWHRDFNRLVEMHKQYRNNVEELLIRPRVVEAVRAYTTVMQAIDLYSGEKLENVRKEIEKELRRTDSQLAQNGVLVDSFIVEKTVLPDKQYVENIEARQRAVIAQSRAQAEERANQAIAEAAKAAALKTQYEQIVAAETAKQTQILQQQAESQRAIIKAQADAENAIVTQKAESEKIILAAKAEAERNVAISEAQKQAEINRAVGIEAVGRAEAEAQRLKLTAFSVPGSDLYTRVEVAKSFATAIDKVRFYPANANFNTIAQDFDTGLSLLVNGQGTSPADSK